MIYSVRNEDRLADIKRSMFAVKKKTNKYAHMKIQVNSVSSMMQKYITPNIKRVKKTSRLVFEETKAMIAAIDDDKKNFLGTRATVALANIKKFLDKALNAMQWYEN